MKCVTFVWASTFVWHRHHHLPVGKHKQWSTWPWAASWAWTQSWALRTGRVGMLGVSVEGLSSSGLCWHILPAPQLSRDEQTLSLWFNRDWNPTPYHVLVIWIFIEHWSRPFYPNKVLPIFKHIFLSCTNFVFQLKKFICFFNVALISFLQPLLCNILSIKKRNHSPPYVLFS